MYTVCGYSDFTTTGKMSAILYDTMLKYGKMLDMILSMDVIGLIAIAQVSATTVYLVVRLVGALLSRG